MPEQSSSRIKYPFRKMEVGENFFVSESENKKLLFAAWNFMKNIDKTKRFSVRKVGPGIFDEIPDGGSGCWRTA